MSTRGELYAVGRIRVTAEDRTVSAALEGGRVVTLDQALGPCTSSASCVGLVSLDFAHSIVAARAYEVLDQTLTLADLATGSKRVACDQVVRYVFTADGKVACSELTLARIVSDGVVLDEGSDINPWSFTRRGDQLVWMHGATERTAPMP